MPVLHNMLQNFLIELDGQPAGRLFGMTGGGVHADVVTTGVGGFSGHKHIGQIKYEDMTLTCGTGMAQAFYNWISDSFGGSTKRKDGAIVTIGSNFKPLSRLEFNHALIRSVEMPACDAGSKDAAHITVSISPERTRSITSDLSQNVGVHVSGLAKGWYINDFKLTIDGLESDCAHVRAIGPLRIGKQLKFDASTNVSDEGPEEYGDLVVTLNSNHAKGFYQWFEDFVEKGNSTDERKGVLQFFAPGANKNYFKLNLLGLGPYEMEGIKPTDPNTAMPLTFKLYCNQIDFSAGAAAVT